MDLQVLIYYLMRFFSDCCKIYYFYHQQLFCAFFIVSFVSVGPLIWKSIVFFTSKCFCLMYIIVYHVISMLINILLDSSLQQVHKYILIVFCKFFIHITIVRTPPAIHKLSQVFNGYTCSFILSIVNFCNVCAKSSMLSNLISLKCVCFFSVIDHHNIVSNIL